VIFSTIKNYALAALAALVGILAILAKYMGAKSKRLEIERDYLKARVNRDRVVAEKDNEIEEQTRSRRADAIKELEDTGASDALRHPDGLWNDETDT